MVTDRFGAENVKKFGVRFTNQVWPGDDLKGTAVVDAVREEGGETLVDLTITTTNQKGDMSWSRGTRRPGARQRLARWDAERVA